MHIFCTMWCFFFNKYLLTSHHIRLKSVVCLEFDLFGFSPTIRCENIVKILHNNDVVEVQTWDSNMGPLKNRKMWQQFWSSLNVFSPTNMDVMKSKLNHYMFEFWFWFEQRTQVAISFNTTTSIKGPLIFIVKIL
jgi:hypothetical protein